MRYEVTTANVYGLTVFKAMIFSSNGDLVHVTPAQMSDFGAIAKAKAWINKYSLPNNIG